MFKNIFLMNIMQSELRVAFKIWKGNCTSICYSTSYMKIWNFKDSELWHIFNIGAVCRKFPLGQIWWIPRLTTQHCTFTVLVVFCLLLLWGRHLWYLLIQCTQTWLIHKITKPIVLNNVIVPGHNIL